jgi:aminotransferase EvaB
MSQSNNSINFLPNQYLKDSNLSIKHNYLKEQFADVDEILVKIKEVVLRGDFTLGSEVDLLENEFSSKIQSRYAIAVGSGTDALFLSLKALDIGIGDEVITTPFTFFATIGAIVTAGAKPVFVDISKDDYNIDSNELESAITDKTKAILPVHWAGRVCDMENIMAIANKFKIKIVEDACHSYLATRNDKYAGTFGITGCFSFHPLKNLNVWGDGGIIVTDDDQVHRKLKLMRNHGLVDRENTEIFSYNSRLDTLQSVVARHMLAKIDTITDSRINNAQYFDSKLSEISEISVPKRVPNSIEVFHLYSILAKCRDELKEYLIINGIDAKIHYPKPMHLQPAAQFLGFKKGSFPIAEFVSDNILSLPVHEFITFKQIDKVVELIKQFYLERK